MRSLESTSSAWERVGNRECRGQSDLHLPRGLSQFSAVLKTNAQHALAVLQIADAQRQLAARQALRRRPRFLDQGQPRAVAGLAADRTEREIICLRVPEQQATGKRLAGSLARMLAAVSLAIRCVNHCACRRGCGRLCRWTSTRPSRAARNRRSV